MRLLRGDHRLVKQVNRTQVLDLFRTLGPLTKSEIAEHTQLTFAAVSKIVRDLESSGIVIPQGEGKSSGGRRPVLYALNPDALYVVAVDVSVEEIRVALMDVHTRIAGERRLPAPSGKNPRDYTLLAARAFRELVEESGVDEGKIIGCGVSTPGPVNAQTGEIFHPPNLPWGVVPFKDLMEEALKMPVKVEKDANLSALGERWRGAGRDVENLIYVLVGEGIGGGIVIGGTLYQGNPFGAGEIGHVTVDIDGFRCNCGNYGCLEAMASGLAVVRRVERELRRGAVSSAYPEDVESITLPVVLKALREGDDLTCRIFDDSARMLGIGLTGVFNSFAPEKVIIGGKMVRAYPKMVEIAAEITRQRVVSVLKDRVSIVPGELGEDASLIGAAALVIEDLFTLHL
ncbi:MAG: ROK family protein [Thermoactinomycetaceae bacterium]|jgi:glucokinase-like ROK family protein|nr:ROK family protein [Bacillota bacterium]MBO2533003.1 ROK family protein [Thermoactinomycetaceae bacterium]